ncbi:FecR domain-containing protein [Rhodoferax sp.]|uniref:FecR family protein n=1 Tax=Rhodoferax sp. TaxID=50421 RepID=UPI0025FA793D|nr:FecR domain-containing protein [Rhodoferax sp.]
MTHSIRQFLTASAILMLASAAALSQAHAEVVGSVKTVTGEAWVITAQQRVKAQVGTPVNLGSQLKTAKASSMGVTFKDNTLMSFGPDTEMTVDEFLFAPTQGQLKLGTRLDKGSLNYVSGLIAKLKPEAVTVKTPTGTIGVRGTQFLLNVDEPAKVN